MKTRLLILTHFCLMAGHYTEFVPARNNIYLRRSGFVTSTITRIGSLTAQLICYAFYLILFVSYRSSNTKLTKEDLHQQLKTSMLQETGFLYCIQRPSYGHCIFTFQGNILYWWNLYFLFHVNIWKIVCSAIKEVYENVFKRESTSIPDDTYNMSCYW